MGRSTHWNSPVSDVALLRRFPAQYFSVIKAALDRAELEIVKAEGWMLDPADGDCVVRIEYDPIQAQPVRLPGDHTGTEEAAA